MPDSDPIQPTRRKTIRRSDDWQLRKQIDRHIKLFHIGQTITSEMNFDVLFDLIADQMKRVMDVERCSVFLEDQKGSVSPLALTAPAVNLSHGIPISARVEFAPAPLLKKDRNGFLPAAARFL